MRVPFVDLRAVNSVVTPRVLDAIRQTIDRGDFTNGEAVAEFERRFADHSGRRRCVAVSSGLDALRLSLVATGLAPGAGVIVPAMTFAATHARGTVKALTLVPRIETTSTSPVPTKWLRSLSLQRWLPGSTRPSGTESTGSAGST